MGNDGNDFEYADIDITKDDPYSGIDLSELPRWWRETVEEFREYGLNPYHPPVFEDGTYKHRVVNELEERLGVDIDFIGTSVSTAGEWTVRVDGRPIGTIGHRRHGDGYSVYEMDGEAFRDWTLERVAELPD